MWLTDKEIKIDILVQNWWQSQQENSLYKILSLYDMEQTL